MRENVGVKNVWKTSEKRLGECQRKNIWYKKRETNKLKKSSEEENQRKC